MKHEVVNIGITIDELPEARERVKKYYNNLLLTEPKHATEHKWFKDEIQRLQQWLRETTKNK